MKRPMNPMAGFVLPKVPQSYAGKTGAATVANFAHHAPTPGNLSHGYSQKLRRPKGGHGPHNPVQG